jgi:hypothetical protein
MSIHPILEKIKTFLMQVKFETYLMILIIILVGLAGFGLGRLSTAGEGRAVIIQTSNVQNQNQSSIPETQDSTKNTASAIESFAGNSNIVASKNGTKYYLPGCSGAGRIQDQNKVYFASEKEAIDAGYTKASGCQ